MLGVPHRRHGIGLFHFTFLFSRYFCWFYVFAVMAFRSARQKTGQNPKNMEKKHISRIISRLLSFYPFCAEMGSPRPDFMRERETAANTPAADHTVLKKANFPFRCGPIYRPVAFPKSSRFASHSTCPSAEKRLPKVARSGTRFFFETERGGVSPTLGSRLSADGRKKKVPRT